MRQKTIDRDLRHPDHHPSAPFVRSVIPSIGKTQMQRDRQRILGFLNESRGEADNNSKLEMKSQSARMRNVRAPDVS
jgi:hypothetical protein